MSNIAICVEQLSKRYTVGIAKQQYNTLRDHLVERLKGVVHRNGNPTIEQKIMWALKDVSFEVRQGEVLGIIGRNGTGKSTLLKILSRITEPTTGYTYIYGRVASLLEVGTGFHGELTGRENIYLNGALLGMTKNEIKRRFDEIVAFSEIEKFIDTPVKRYSSGMTVRLAFSVAAHLEAEILIMDEVLAVGDIGFQKKCLEKMEEVAHGGRTVLFVSHNMGAIANLCSSALWLEAGEVTQRGNVESVIDSYITSMADESPEPKEWQHSGSGEALIVDIRLLDAQGNERKTFNMGETLTVEFGIEFYRDFDVISLSLEINRTDTLLPVVHLLSEDTGFLLHETIKGGIHYFRVDIPQCPLYPLSYAISVGVENPSVGMADYIQNALEFTILQSNISQRTTPFHRNKGVFHCNSLWENAGKY